MLNRALTVVSASVLLLVSACGSTEDGTEMKLDVPESPRAEIRTEFRGWRNDDTTIDNMEERLLERCMRKASFRYAPELAHGQETATDSTLDPDVYRLTARQAASATYPASGEKSAPEGNSSGGDTRNAGLAGLSAARQKAWTAAFQGEEGQTESSTAAMPGGGKVDIELGGCRLTTTKELYGSLANAQQVAFTDSNLAITALTAAADDSAMGDLDGAWRSCMATRGFSKDERGEELARPEDARVLARDRPARSRAIVTADAACQKSTNYASTRERLEDRYLTAVANFYEPQITGSLAAKREALANGKRILG